MVVSVDIVGKDRVLFVQLVHPRAGMTKKLFLDFVDLVTP
jgi:hypothetical protein